MSKKIPLFPLSLVAFPGENLRLHIFEPKYRQLIQDCLAYDLSFGIITVFDKKLSETGTELVVSEVVHTYPDGKMDIVTKGLKAFNLLHFEEKISDKLYPGGEVELLEDIMDTQLLLQQKVFQQIAQLYKTMGMKISLPEPDYDYTIYTIAHKIGMTTMQELELLKIRSEVERLEYVHAHLDKLIPVVSQMEDMRNKVRMNGYFKDALPPDFKL